MKTATRLSLGFGALILLLIISNAAVILPMEWVGGNIQAITQVGRPRWEAARSLEGGVLTYSLAVRNYARSRNQIHLKEAEAAITEVEALRSEYLQLAETARERELGERFLGHWLLLKERSRAITNGPARFYGDEDWQPIIAIRMEIMRLLREEMQPDARIRYDNSSQTAIYRVEVIQRMAVISFILSLVAAVSMSHAVGRAVLRSEKEIQSKREHLRATLTSIADAVITTDKNGIVTSINRAAEGLTGWTQEEAIGQPLGSVASFIDEATGAEAESPALKALREGTAVRTESVLIAARAGTSVPIEDHVAPIHNLKGETVGNVLVIRDVTERKMNERALRKSQEELEVLVKQRTFELAETHADLVREMEVHAIAEKNRIHLLGRLVRGQEDERRRIARDLHDQLGQRLTALRLKIRSLKDAAADDEIMAPKIEHLQEIARRLDSEVSYLVWELRPTVLDDLGFTSALRAFVQEWMRHFEIRADHQIATISKRRFDPQTETHLYRIAQEALNNVAKHANATQVSVVLEKRGEGIILIIEDDGVGFVPGKISVPEKSGNGLGLLGMQERATLIGGDVEIESAPGNGTTIYVRVPFAAARNDKSI
jgi:PAS domain S-box-containing protein